MQIKIKILAHCFLLITFLGACQQEIETNSKNLDKILQKEKITIIEEHFGGIGGSIKKKMEFLNRKDSIRVTFNDIDVNQNPPLSIQISGSTFAEIIEGIRCLVLNHNNDIKPTAGCIIPSPNQYYLV